MFNERSLFISSSFFFFFFLVAHWKLKVLMSVSGVSRMNSFSLVCDDSFTPSYQLSSFITEEQIFLMDVAL